jgi:hypothetical protein
LSVFETRPELSTAELARISQVTRQTMHTSTLSLEGAGLDEREARNQRVVLPDSGATLHEVPGGHARGPSTPGARPT